MVIPNGVWEHAKKGLTGAKLEGFIAFCDGKGQGANPHRRETPDSEAWFDGWYIAFTVERRELDR